MEENKPWYHSITIIGAAVAGIATALPEIINTLQMATGWQLSANPIVAKVLAIAGVIVAIYGRLTAKTTLK